MFSSAIFRSPAWFVLFVLAITPAVFRFAQNLVLQMEETPAVRGQRIALANGCFSCHGPDGVGRVKNPGAPDGEVPGFTEGTPMMWVADDAEIREYILDGWPKRKAEDLKYQDKIKDQLLFMPAYRGRLSEREVDDLVAYIRAASGLVGPQDEVALSGYDIAFEQGCFACHGPMGAGGVGNPGSFKGYIPGWWGDDFRDLVRDDGELREWIENGKLSRLEDNAVASYFTRGQIIQMPPYKNRLTEAQIEAVMAYVRWVNRGEWQSRALVTH